MRKFNKIASYNSTYLSIVLITIVELRLHFKTSHIDQCYLLNLKNKYGLLDLLIIFIHSLFFCFLLYSFVFFCLFLFSFVLFCFVLFYFILSSFVFFCFHLFYFILFYFIFICFNLFILFCFNLFCFHLFCFVLSCFVFRNIL